MTTLVLHADNGHAVASADVSLLLRHLGITELHSRPYVRDDDPGPAQIVAETPVTARVFTC